MEIPLQVGTKIRAIVTIENYLSEESEIIVFLILEEFLNKFSFKRKFTISPHENKILSTSFVVQNPINGKNSVESIGTIRILVDNVESIRKKLPAANFLSSIENPYDYLGIRIILWNKRAKIYYRIKKQDD